MQPKRTPFTSAQLESLCKAIAHTETGLTGTEIGHLLAQVRVADVDPAARVEWPMPEADALDLLSLASYAHRRLRAAKARSS